MPQTPLSILLCLTILCLISRTPAPVGQPHQIIAAHVWNMLVGMAINLIPTGNVIDFVEWKLVSSEYGMPLIWNVSGQAYLGILHPPATGLSFSFATHDKWSWVSRSIGIHLILLRSEH